MAATTTGKQQSERTRIYHTATGPTLAHASYADSAQEPGMTHGNCIDESTYRP